MYLGNTTKKNDKRDKASSRFTSLFLFCLIQDAIHVEMVRFLVKVFFSSWADFIDR